MPSNLSNVGFAAQTGAEMEQLARQCYDRGTRTRCKEGTYVVWPVGQGIEIWVQLSPKDELVGLNPHFSGMTRTSLGLMSRVTRSGFPMDGGFMSLAQPFGNAPIQGAFTLLFDVPDFHAHDELVLPLIQTVQLAAFAQQCVLYENEEDFRSRIVKRGGKMQPDTVIPLGLFDADRAPLPEPLATAMVCGKVFNAAKVINPISNHEFYWARIKSAAGEVDVVADPELLPGLPRENQVLQCSAWLSGRLIR